MKQGKAVLLTALAVLLVCGCQRHYSGLDGFVPETNSIYVTKDGEIASGMTETFDKGKQENYQQESLENFVLEEVALFNESLGAPRAAANEEGKDPLPVSVYACSLKDARVTAVYQYKDSKSFLEFGSSYFNASDRLKNFAVCTVEQALREGWLVTLDLVKPLKDGGVKTSDSQELGKLEKGQVVYVETEYPVKIQVEGKIRYMTKDVTAVDKHIVQVPAGAHYLLFW